MNWRAHIASIAVSLGFSTMGSGATIDQNWDSRFDLAPGLNGRVFTMLGAGTNLYVGGHSPLVPPTERGRIGVEKPVSSSKVDSLWSHPLYGLSAFVTAVGAVDASAAFYQQRQKEIKRRLHAPKAWDSLTSHGRYQS
jgi:hypothetical protein